MRLCLACRYRPVALCSRLQECALCQDERYRDAKLVTVDKRTVEAKFLKVEKR